MVMSGVPFSLRQFNDPKTEAFCSGHRRLAQEVNLSPIKFQAIDILYGGDHAGARFVHRSVSASVGVRKERVRAFGLESYMSYLWASKRKRNTKLG